MKLFGWKSKPVPIQCKHEWDIESTNYTPPRDNVTKAKGDPDLIRAVLEGVTNVYMRCVHCRDLKDTKVFGHYEPPIKVEE